MVLNNRHFSLTEPRQCNQPLALAGKSVPSDLCSSEISNHFLKKEEEKENTAGVYDSVGSRGGKEREKIYKYRNWKKVGRGLKNTTTVIRQRE
jgi:hypothetical protein